MRRLGWTRNEHEGAQGTGHFQLDLPTPILLLDRNLTEVASADEDGRFRDRDRDDRDREGPRFMDSDIRSRDSRDDREARERDMRMKVDRTSHEPPQSARDVSPPPIAPAAPSFGSIPNRTPSISEASTGTVKAPPTGPRALKDERPPTGPAAISEARLPPTGPSKPAFPERGPESPKASRSQSFVSNRFPGFRSDGPGDQQPEGDRRPRSSDTQAEFQSTSSDAPNRGAYQMEEGEEFDKGEIRTKPAGSLGDRDHKSDETSKVLESPTFAKPVRKGTDLGLPEVAKEIAADQKPAATNEEKPRVSRKPTLCNHQTRDHKRPQKKIKAPIIEQASDSDDEEMGDHIADQMGDTESKLKQLEAREDSVPLDAIVRHVSMSLEAVNKLVFESEGLLTMVGPIPDGAKIPPETAVEEVKPQPEEAPVDVVMEGQEESSAPEPVPKSAPEPAAPEPPRSEKAPSEKPPSEKAPSERAPSVRAPSVRASSVKAPSVRAPSVKASSVKASSVKAPSEKAQSPVLLKTPLPPSPAKAEVPHPSIEQDVDMMDHQPATADGDSSKAHDGDVVMEDAIEAPKADQAGSLLGVPKNGQTNGVVSPKSRRSSLYPGYEPPLSTDRSRGATSTPTPVEDDDETDIDDMDSRALDTVRVQMNTPPLSSLPDFDDKPWFEDQNFVKSLNTPATAFNAFLLQNFEDTAMEHIDEQQEQQKLYAANYEAYLRFTMSNDPAAVKSRERFTPGTTDAPSHKVGWNGETKPESTRRSRYASERDLERILEESRRVEDEKRERAERAEKEKYRIDAKEAIPPLQYQTPEERENEFYVDTTGYLEPNEIVAAWEVLPPVNNFTEEEVALFEKAYLEFPKQWGKVADPLPNRDFGTSIQFYYLKKEKDELNLKEKLKKRPRTRKRGRGKQRSSALVSELGNGDNEVEENHETGENGERRRPRRAAAPTFNSEATPATDGEATGTSTPSRRGAKHDGEKPERKQRGRRAAKDKEHKQQRANQTLAAAPSTPAATGKTNRSRSSSRVQPPADWAAAQQAQTGVIPNVFNQYEATPGTSAVPSPSIPAPFSAAKPIVSPERAIPSPVPGTISEVMAPPKLRPEPPQPSVPTPFDIKQPPSSDHKANSGASSYWSVPEMADFPALLSSFGSDWAAIANHMRTKTTVMVKNYYARKKGENPDWEGVVTEAENMKSRGEKLPLPPTPTPNVKKRYDTSTPTTRPISTPDTPMEDVPPPKMEQPPPAPPPPPPQAMSGRFSVPIAAQPPPASQSPFSQPPQTPVVPQQAPTTAPTPSQPLVQPVTQAMSPSVRPLRAPFAYPEREREPALQQPARTPLVQKVSQPSTPVAEPLNIRHPLPGSMMDSQPERQMQEPDAGGSPYETFVPSPGPGRMQPPRQESSPVIRNPEPPRVAPPASQAPFQAILQQPPGRFFNDMNPSPPVTRPLSALSRSVTTEMNSPGEHFNSPPTQPTPPVAAPMPPRPVERKTSSIMSLLNDDPPPRVPKRVNEVPAAAVSKPSPTPPPQNSRPPPPPPPPSHVRREQMSEAPAYPPYGRNPPPAPSSMPSLKPYNTASPQPQHQPLGTPRHMVMDPQAERAERDYFARQRQYSSPHQQAMNSPQISHPYPPQAQAAPMPYQPQPGYGYGGPAQQAPSAASPPPQYGGHIPVTRAHEPPPPPPGREMVREMPRDMPRDMPREMRNEMAREMGREMGHGRDSSRDMGREMGHSRDMSREMGREMGHSRDMSREMNREMAAREMGWPGSHPAHGIPPQQQQPPPQWGAPKMSQPPPAQSPWAAQHATTPKPPPPSSSVPPQPTWAAPPAPPRGHDPRGHDPRDVMNLRDARDLYPQHRQMQPPMQPQYAPVSRAPEPPPAQTPVYPRYATPAPGRDPRDPGPPPRSYTPSAYDARSAYATPVQDPREMQLREQQMQQQQQHQQQMQQQQQQQQHQSVLQQQLRPQDRNMYDGRQPPDRYGR
ncbi:Myb-like DNA-binding protein [Apiospora arundinis]